MNVNSERGFGSYGKKKENIRDVTFFDFRIPWNFFLVFLHTTQETVINWLRENGLLTKSFVCSICGEGMSEQKRSKNIDGYVFKCRQCKKECTIRANSFFEKSKINLRDLMLFFYEFLNGNTLYNISVKTGLSYTSSIIDWANLTRDIFREYVYNEITNEDNPLKLKGEIEIDEAKFGRCQKNQMGKRRGMNVWVFGMMERATGKSILYPVKDRTSETLIPLIQKHCEIGSRIFSDGWESYNRLNQLGYQHFTVIHSYQFRRIYENVITKEVISCDINHIEGSWAHAKKHFRRMNGCNKTTFEGHLCEILFRNHTFANNFNIFDNFFTSMKTFYDTSRKHVFNTPNGIFGNWMGDENEDMEITRYMGGEDFVENLEAGGNNNAVEPIPGPSRKRSNTEDLVYPNEAGKGIRAPENYKTTLAPNKKKPKVNNYTKEAYVFYDSDDDDFK